MFEYDLKKKEFSQITDEQVGTEICIRTCINKGISFQW